jgi:hypothetical protein
MKIIRDICAGAILFAGAATSAHAGATLTTSFATWTANAPGYLTTSSDPNYAGGIFAATTSSIGTSAGGTLTTSPGSDAILQTFTDWGPWTGANGAPYHGIVYDTVGQTESITIPFMFTAFSLEIQPDLSGPGASDVITVTLSDGQTTTINIDDSVPGATAFVGYYGGRETSMTISVQNASDFAFGDFRIVPEPASIVLFATGLSLMGFLRRRSR